MKKQWIGLATAFAMLLTLLPCPAFAIAQGITFATEGFSSTWTNTHSDITITAVDNGVGIASMTVNGNAVTLPDFSVQVEENGTPFYRLKQIAYDDTEKLLKIGVFLGNFKASGGQVAFKYNTNLLTPYNTDFFDEGDLTNDTRSTYFAGYDVREFASFGLSRDQGRLSKSVTLVPFDSNGNDVNLNTGAAFVSWYVSDSAGVDGTLQEQPLCAFSFKLKDGVSLQNLDSTAIVLPTMAEVVNASQQEAPSVALITISGTQDMRHTANNTLLQAVTINGRTYNAASTDANEMVYKFSGNTQDAVNGVFRVIAVDNSGIQYTEDIETKVDTTKPSLSVVCNTTAPAQSVDIEVSYSDAQSGIKHVTVNGEAFEGASGSTYTARANGAYTFVATDNAGNTETKSVTVTNIDTTAPTVVSVSGNPTTWQTGSATITVTFSETCASVLLDGTSIGTNTNEVSFVASENKTYSLQFTDAAGNQGSESIAVQFIDKVSQISAPAFDKRVNGQTIVISNISVPEQPASDISFVAEIYKDGECVHQASITDPAEGISFIGEEGESYRVTVRATTGAGVSNSKTETVEIPDVTPPTILISGVSDDWVTEDAQIVITATDKSGIQSVHANGEQLTAQADGTYLYVVSTDGETTVNIVVLDNKNNQASESVTVKLDKTAPTMDVSAAPATPVQQHTFSISNVNDAHSGVLSVTVNGTDITNQSTYTVNENDTYEFVVTDVAGNSLKVTRTVTTIDTEKPMITVTGNPTAWTNSNVVLQITTNETCNIIINGEDKGQTTATSFTVEQNGDVVIEAVDLAGNRETETISVGFIDKTEPVLIIGDEPTEACQSATLSVDASDTESGIKHVTVNGIDITNDTSFDITENGNYNFVATDNAGNTTRREVIISVIDNENPVITHDFNAASGWTNQSISITISLDKDDCALTVNDAPLSISNRRAVLTIEQNGTFELKATDAAGNVGTTTIVVRNIDKDAPDVRAQAESVWAQTSKITIMADDQNGSGIKTVTVGGEAASFDNGEYSFNVTQNGSYEVIVTDYAGNSWSDTVTVSNIDNQKPNLAVSADNTTISQTREITVTYSDMESGIKRVTVNGEPFEGASGSTYIARANGEYTFVATDNAGNTETKSVTVTNVDTTAPTVASVNGNPTTWQSGSATITVTISETCARILVDGNEIATNTNTATFSATENRSYAVTMYDIAGNVGSHAVVVSKLDNELPTLTLVSKPAEWARSGEIQVRAADALSGVRFVKQNGQTLTPNGDVYTVPVSANGSYTFEVEDSAGNTNSLQVEVDKIDTTVPNLTAVTDNTTISQTREITVTYSDMESGIKHVTVNGEPFEGASGSTYTARANGEYTFVATDNAGNTKTESVTVTNIDNTAPVFNGEIELVNATETTLSLRLPIATDANSVVQAVYVDDVWKANYVVSDYTLDNLSIGTAYRVKVVATDIAGNQAEKSKEVSTIGRGSIIVSINTGDFGGTTPSDFTATVGNTTMPFDAQGKAVFANLVSGSYSVKVEAAGYRAFTKENVVVGTAGDTTVVVNTTTEFVAGEIVADGVLDIFDLNAIASNFVSAYTDAALKKFDLNRDGNVDEQDILLFIRNYEAGLGSL